MPALALYGVRAFTKVFLFQAYKAWRSFTGSAQGGRRSHGGAARALPAPAPARRVGRNAKPFEVARRPRVHFSRFWDQSLALGALQIRRSNHQLEACLFEISTITFHGHSKRHHYLQNVVIKYYPINSENYSGTIKSLQQLPFVLLTKNKGGEE